jgi:hypothetical protein
MGGILVLLAILLLTGGVLLHTGLALCYATPRHTPPKVWSLATLLFLGLTLGLLGATAYQLAENNAEVEANKSRKDIRAKSGKPTSMGIEGAAEEVELPYEPESITTFGYMVIGVSCLEWVAFLLFLGSVARYLEQPKLALHTLVYLGATILLSGAWFVAAWALGATSPPAEDGTVPGLQTATWIALAVAVTLSIWFLFLVFSVRHSITKALRAAG